MEIMELDQEKVLGLLPDRRADSHKGCYGKILLLCGSRGYTGAAAMAAMGALRSGAGLVYLGVPEGIYPIEAVKLNEPIVFPLPEKDGCLGLRAAVEIGKMLPKMNGVLMGCGLGLSEGTGAALRLVLEQFDGPVVVDADGINLLREHMDVLRGRKAPTVLTPHEGEFVRLTESPVTDRVSDAKRWAKQLGCIMVLKGHGTIITDGEAVYRNPTGNPGMAVGGSGDVLAGVIISLLGQGLPALEAAAVGAWLHGAAGDRCAEKIGQYGMLPTDMLLELPRLMK